MNLEKTLKDIDTIIPITGNINIEISKKGKLK